MCVARPSKQSVEDLVPRARRFDTTKRVVVIQKSIQEEIRPKSSPSPQQTPTTALQSPKFSSPNSATNFSPFQQQKPPQQLLPNLKLKGNSPPNYQQPQTLNPPASTMSFLAQQQQQLLVQQQQLSGGNTEKKKKHKKTTPSKIPRQYKELVSDTVVNCLSKYMKAEKISSKEDFKHLARKLTHLCCEKEQKHGRVCDARVFNDKVKGKQIRSKIKNFVVTFFEATQQHQLKQKTDDEIEGDLEMSD